MSLKQSLQQPVLLQLLPRLQQMLAHPAVSTSNSGSMLETGLALLLARLTEGGEPRPHHLQLHEVAAEQPWCVLLR